MDLVEAVYKLSEQFPGKGKFGLTSQLQRAAVSVPANIAEGYGRVRRGDYMHRLSIARRSLAELETHIAISVRLGYALRDDALKVWDIAQEVGEMLRSMIQTMQRAVTAQELDAKRETLGAKVQLRSKRAKTPRMKQ